MAVRLGDTAPDFTAPTTAGRDPLPRVARRQLGRAVQPPEGLHPGVHHRARLRRQDQAGVRQAQRQGHRPVGRPGRQPREVGSRHRRDPGHAGELPDDRRPGAQGRRPVRHDPPQRQRHDDRALGVRHRPGQEGQAHAHLPGVDRPQLRRDPAGDRLPAAHRRLQGGHPGQLEGRRRRDHRRRGLRRRGQAAVPPGLDRRQALPAHAPPAEQEVTVTSAGSPPPTRARSAPVGGGAPAGPRGSSWR